jgi:hypothetical protein
MDKSKQLSPDQLLPFERAGESKPADMSLFEKLGSDHPAFAEPEEPEAPGGPAPTAEEEPDEGDEDDAEESEEEAEEAETEDESEDEGEPAQKDGEPQLFPREPGGKEMVTLEELQQGSLRTADYTRKTQALAAEKATELTALRTARQQYAGLLERLEKAVAEEVPAEPDWDRIRAEDPDGYAARYADHQRAVSRVRAVQAEQDRVAGEEQRDQVAQWNAHLATEEQALVGKVPEWKDPEVSKRDRGEMATYAQTTYGYTPEDLSNVADHRIMVLLRKAMLYDKQHSKGEKVLREKVKVAKVLTPGTKQAGAEKGGRPSRRKALQRAQKELARSGRVSDAARVFENLLDD